MCPSDFLIHAVPMSDDRSCCSLKSITAFQLISWFLWTLLQVSDWVQQGDQGTPVPGKGRIALMGTYGSITSGQSCLNSLDCTVIWDSSNKSLSLPSPSHWSELHCSLMSLQTSDSFFLIFPHKHFPSKNTCITNLILASLECEIETGEIEECLWPNIFLEFFKS